MPLSQRKVGVLFKQADSPEETEELVLAYCFAKWQTGRDQSAVLRKLHLLCLYLRAIDLGLKLREHYSAFAIAASLTKSNPMPVILVPSTALGLEAWNAARRPSKNVIKRVLTSNPHHIEILPLNPSAASSLSNLSSGDGHDDGEDDEDQQTLRPQPQRGVSSFLGGGNGGGRSRTNTVSAIVVAPGASADAQRLQAGAGDGLGRGLLSAPPNYDGNLARYLEADAHISDPHAYAIRPLDPDIDFLPDYF
ncbi:hypothetical protein BMF94_4201 [Rhodotorula taiwanensis]|uniref:Uncharacterized protein n=1 Tax=Rhodotorula taiwanensis TaxID=741276 RepID=A0A2S5B7N5_9BASI|nr:hypothetical protein BMF94_4201 [Rhodotorula taiwanensis]